MNYCNALLVVHESCAVGAGRIAREIRRGHGRRVRGARGQRPELGGGGHGAAGAPHVRRGGDGGGPKGWTVHRDGHARVEPPRHALKVVQVRRAGGVDAVELAVDVVALALPGKPDPSNCKPRGDTGDTGRRRTDRKVEQKRDLVGAGANHQREALDGRCGAEEHSVGRHVAVCVRVVVSSSVAEIQHGCVLVVREALRGYKRGKQVSDHRHAVSSVTPDLFERAVHKRQRLRRGFCHRVGGFGGSKSIERQLRHGKRPCPHDAMKSITSGG